MSKLLKGTALFILISAVFIFILEKKYEGYITPYDIIFKGVKENAETYTDIYIGNSHTQALKKYTPDSNVVILNIATPGQDVFKTLTILKKWLPQLKNVKNIYWGLDYETLGQNLSLSGLAIDDRQLYRYTDSLYKNDYENFLMAKSNFFRANRDIGFLFAQQANKDEVAFIPPSNKSNMDDCRKRALEHSRIRFKKSLIEENTRLLADILALVKSYKINLMAFNPPKSKCFEANLFLENSMMARNTIDSVFRKNNLKYFDFFNSSSFNSDDFLDYDHLNKKGAEKLIGMINEEAHVGENK